MVCGFSTDAGAAGYQIVVSSACVCAARQLYGAGGMKARDATPTLNVAVAGDANAGEQAAEINRAKRVSAMRNGAGILSMRSVNRPSRDCFRFTDIVPGISPAACGCMASCRAKYNRRSAALKFADNSSRETNSRVTDAQARQAVPYTNKPAATAPRARAQRGESRKRETLPPGTADRLRTTLVAQGVRSNADKTAGETLALLVSSPARQLLSICARWRRSE